jgi:hypothetical protein
VFFGCGLRENCNRTKGRTRQFDIHVGASQVQINSGQLKETLLKWEGKQTVKTEREGLTGV